MKKTANREPRTANCSIISTGKPEYLIDSGLKQFRLTEALLVEYKGKVIFIPSGFTCDLASIPDFVFWWRHGAYNISAVVHDYNYIYRKLLYFQEEDLIVSEITRAQSDRLFWELNKQLGVHPIVNFLMWLAVRCFGWRWWKSSNQ